MYQFVIFNKSLFKCLNFSYIPEAISYQWGYLNVRPGLADMWEKSAVFLWL